MPGYEETPWHECQYYMRGLPGADPQGTCSFGCYDEPNCMTGRPSEGWSPWDAEVERLGSQCAALTREIARLRSEVESVIASYEDLPHIVDVPHLMGQLRAALAEVTP